MNNIPIVTVYIVAAVGKLRAMEAILNIPALFHNFSEISEDELKNHSLASLNCFLSRSSVQDNDAISYEAGLYQNFVAEKTGEDKIPYASLTAILDGLTLSDNSAVMRADPVFLYPDTHSLILQDPAGLNLQRDEIEAVREAINPLLEDYQAKLHTPHQSRWYLEFTDAAPEI